MNQEVFLRRFMDQINDIVWVVDSNYRLVYTNDAYQRVISKIIGAEKKINETAFLEQLGEGDIGKWKSFYDKALKGSAFEVEDQFRHPETTEIQYSQISFNPIYDDDEIVGVTCVSRDITEIVRGRYESNEVVDSSLDVFCSVDENGIFINVSAASEKLWGVLS